MGVTLEVNGSIEALANSSQPFRISKRQVSIDILVLAPHLLSESDTSLMIFAGMPTATFPFWN